ncbi:MAG: A/G-specific adenine glycosylase [Bacilli bacterium]
MKEKSFGGALLQWYEVAKRDLPWRQSRDPYYIWVSEVMLQQTRVDTVIPYYNRWIERFPTITHFAEASEEEVLKMWEGLGYYRRVKNLHTAIKEVNEQYNANVPQNYEQFHALKGVGDYTAGAVMSIAYGMPKPAVDGNVMRVYTRLYNSDLDIAKVSTKRQIETWVSETMVKSDPSSFNQALMELGATVCTPKKPACLHCPVLAWCEAYEAGTVDQLPVKTKAKKNRIEQFAVVVLWNLKGDVYVTQRPENGLLGGMWDFLFLQASEEEELCALITSIFETPPKNLSYWGEEKHIFSHITWEMKVYTANIDSDDSSFVPLDAALKLPRSVAMQKVYDRVPHE